MTVVTMSHGELCRYDTLLRASCVEAVPSDDVAAVEVSVRARGVISRCR